MDDRAFFIADIFALKKNRGEFHLSDHQCSMDAIIGIVSDHLFNRECLNGPRMYVRGIYIEMGNTKRTVGKTIVYGIHTHIHILMATIGLPLLIQEKDS